MLGGFPLKDHSWLAETPVRARGVQHEAAARPTVADAMWQWWPRFRSSRSGSQVRPPVLQYSRGTAPRHVNVRSGAGFIVHNGWLHITLKPFLVDRGWISWQETRLKQQGWWQRSMHSRHMKCSAAK